MTSNQGRKRRRIDFFPYLLLLPSVVALGVLLLYPLGKALVTSFTRNILTRPELGRPFIGLKNYSYILGQPRTWHALMLAAWYSLAVVPSAMLVGLVTALALREDFKGRSLYRVGVIIPWVVPPVVTALVWSWMFDYQFGIVNYILRTLGLIRQPIGWLITKRWAMPSMFVVGTWKMYPIASIMLLAGLQSIPGQFYEAAKIDGANAWQRLRYITLPGLKPVSGLLSLLLVLWSFKSFTYFYLMTGGGPSEATETAVVLVYLQAFKFFDFGVASALGIIILMILVVFTVFYMRAIYARDTGP